ncbi:YecA family protein [Pantoea sp.]|uniref:YecA/YgfB family protein n=1 Tax=Pantoea sp. TaxID=69393 RepID=UPI0028A7816D|nr:YecA family protein [Pantoea sp.]
MNQGPLTEKELNWLEEMLEKYGNEHSVVDVAELDGMLTALLSGPNDIEPSEWLVAMWGGQKYIPKWSSEREMDRFMTLTFQHMNDIAERLSEFPDQFDPLFGTREMEGQEFTVVEEWCFGYMRGVTLDDWSTLPQAQQPALEAIALHGSEENFAKLDGFSPEQFEASIEAILPAALQLHDYWQEQRLAQPEPAPQVPYFAGEKVGRNDPCPCGSGKKYKQCCMK